MTHEPNALLPEVSRLVSNALEIARTYNELNVSDYIKKEFALIEQELADAVELLSSPHAVQQSPARDGLREALTNVRDFALQYIGCACDVGDCGPGDCWPCRMMDIADRCNEALTQPSASEPIAAMNANSEAVRSLVEALRAIEAWGLADGNGSLAQEYSKRQLHALIKTLLLNYGSTE